MSETFPSPPFLTPCEARTPPPLPDKWHAVALLTPFYNSQLLVADIYYDWSVQAMRVTLYGLEQGYADVLYTPDGFYLLASVEPSGPPEQCFGPISMPSRVPSPNWLETIDVECQGLQEILGVNSSWWVGFTPCTNGYQNPPPLKPPNVANWFWFREDNLCPWRMMFINQDNPYHLPVLGYFPVVHLPTFEPVSSTDLPAILHICQSQVKPLDKPLQITSGQDIEQLVASNSVSQTRIDQDTIQTMIQQLIPGLRPPPQDCELPYWPDRLFLTSLSTPTPGPVPNPTQVYYDWPSQRMLTRLYGSDNSLEDAILTDSTTYLIKRFANGTHQCLKKLPVGLPRPNWPTHDGGQCKAVIENNPDLSPNRTTQVIVLPSTPGRVFWIWYTTENEAVMFVEVPQLCDVQLVLTDYFDYQANPQPFDKSLFEIPPDCL